MVSKRERPQELKPQASARSVLVSGSVCSGLKPGPEFLPGLPSLLSINLILNGGCGAPEQDGGL